MSPFEVFIMPSVETLNRFVARVEAKAHIEAVEEFYAEHSRCARTKLNPEPDVTYT